MAYFSFLVNRQNPLSPQFVPESLTEPAIPFHAPVGDPRRLLCREAAHGAEALFTQAKHQGLSLCAVSGYRSYERQAVLYKNAQKRFLAKTPQQRQEALMAVAPPGCSEHQSGLALDVSCASISYELEETFADTSEGKWLARNAPLHGFILRFPKGKEPITGFPYEPWHIRYTGKPLSFYLTMTGLTLEEYYEL